jgi:hypothetical protein
MTENYPYMIANNKIDQILTKLRQAAEPSKFTHPFLVTIGFKSTNDRGIIPLLKRLDFINEDGSPTPFYKYLRDQTQWKSILATKIKELYSDLYVINTEIHNASDEELKGAISRVTGKDSKTVLRYFTTFKALTALADFKASKIEKTTKKKETEDTGQENKGPALNPPEDKPIKDPQFHYNIQIHLPATTDVSVYNAIFKSIKENLMR